MYFRFIFIKFQLCTSFKNKEATDPNIRMRNYFLSIKLASLFWSIVKVLCICKIEIEVQQVILFFQTTRYYVSRMIHKADGAAEEKKRDNVLKKAAVDIGILK